MTAISIVTPSLNQAQFLESAILSVLEQGYPGLEYAVIDGGSTDGSLEIIKKYEGQVHRWVSEQDGGMYDAICKGFAGSSGDIMGWVNSSDMLYPWTLRTVEEIFSQLPQVSWISGTPTIFSEHGGRAPTSVLGLHGGVNKYDVLSRTVVYLQQESMFWRRSLWDSVGGLDTRFRYAGDYDLWLRFFEDEELWFVDTILGGFRRHAHRLGETSGSDYDREALRAWTRFVAAQPRAERFKAGLVRANNTRLGRTLTRTLRGLGLMDWYRHYCIAYDHDAGRWFAHVK